MLVPSCRWPRQHGQFSASKVERGQIKSKIKSKRRRQAEFSVGSVEAWEKSNRCRRKIRSRPGISISSMLLIKQPQGQTADLKRVRLKLSVKPDMECGGKRSATPLWIDALAR